MLLKQHWRETVVGYNLHLVLLVQFIFDNKYSAIHWKFYVENSLDVQVEQSWNIPARAKLNC